MNRRISIGTFALLALLLAACTQSDNNALRMPDENEVCFIGNIRPASRAIDNTFEHKDAISVYAYNKGLYADNRKYIYENNRFVAASAEDKIILPENGDSLSYRALYPYNKDAGPSFVYDVMIDQSVGKNYTLSDLMAASTVATISQTPNLKFNHCLTNVILNLSFDKQPAGAIRVDILNVATTVLADLTTNTFKGQESRNKTIRPAANGSNSFKAILPPQTIEEGTLFLNINTENGVYTCKMPKTIEWKSGVQYTYQVNINKRGEVTFTADIETWENGTQRLVQMRDECLDSLGNIVDRVADFVYDDQDRLIQYTYRYPANAKNEVFDISYIASSIIVTHETNGLTEITRLQVDPQIKCVTNIEFTKSNGKFVVLDLKYEGGFLTLISGMDAAKNPVHIPCAVDEAGVSFIADERRGPGYWFAYETTNKGKSPVNYYVTLLDSIISYEEDFKAIFPLYYLPSSLLGKGMETIPMRTYHGDLISFYSYDYKCMPNQYGYIESILITEQNGQNHTINFTYK